MKEEPKKYYYTNPETGEVEEISRETHDFMQRFLPRVKNGMGRVFVAGTADSFKDIFDGSSIHPLEMDEVGMLPTRRIFDLSRLDEICEKAKADLHISIELKFIQANIDDNWKEFGRIIMRPRRLGVSFKSPDYPEFKKPGDSGDSGRVGHLD